MTEREKHPTWFQAAYADLAQRMARVDERLDGLCRNFCSGRHEGAVAPVRMGIKRPESRTVRPQ